MPPSPSEPAAVLGSDSELLLRRLLQAHRVITQDLSLPAMLNRILAAACELAGVGDGAVAVLHPDAHFERVVSVGVGAEFVGHLPLPLSADPFSLHAHPALGTFVALPLRADGELYAVLTVAQPAGHVPGSGLDEALAAFATAAGTAIENARRYDEARRSRDWLNASGEIARALLAEEDMPLDVVSRALHVAEADLGSLILPTSDGRLQVSVSVGVGSGDWEGFVFDPQQSAAGRAMARGESLLVPDVMLLAADHYVNVHRYGPMMLAPLIDAKGIRGAVVLMRLSGQAGFSSADLDLATTFADQVALALELNDMRADAESLRALQDRHRIAQDLHDNVIQRLFAIGVGLQGVANHALPPAAAERLRHHIADLDETIDEIRETVFGLRGGDPAGAVRQAGHFPRVPWPSAPGPSRPDGQR